MGGHSRPGVSNCTGADPPLCRVSGSPVRLSSDRSAGSRRWLRGHRISTAVRPVRSISSRCDRSGHRRLRARCVCRSGTQQAASNDRAGAVSRHSGRLMTDLLASRAFGLDDQETFARMSSDWNPMHLDAGFARRTQVGAPVVHGIHNLIWATNAALATCPIRISNISARFLQPLYLDEIASVRFKRRTETRIDIEVVAADTVVATIRLSSEAGKIDVGEPPPAQAVS